MEIVIQKDQAEREVDAWIESKKILPTNLEKLENERNRLIEATMFGFLEWKEDSMVQRLQTSHITDVPSLTYSFRANAATLNQGMHDVKEGDHNGMFVAYIASLTKKNKSIIKLLDSSDLTIAKSYAAFFL